MRCNKQEPSVSVQSKFLQKRAIIINLVTKLSEVQVYLKITKEQVIKGNEKSNQ